MRRRHFIEAGMTLGLASLAGCSGDDGEADTQPEDEGTTEDGTTDDEPSGGDGTYSYSIEPSATEIAWGDEYTVTVTVEGDDDLASTQTGMLYRAEGDVEWSGLDDTTKQWSLDTDESETVTFDVTPPTVGEITFGLGESESDAVIDEWGLTVDPPQLAFEETQSYYDGLDVTIDIELHDWLEFELEWNHNPIETGTYSVRPNDGKWIKVQVTAENTNTNTAVTLPEIEKFTGLAGNSQLDLKPEGYGPDVGSGTQYEIDDQTRHEEGARLAMEVDGDVKQEGFWYPPDTLISGAVEEGWMVFGTDMDTTVEDVQIRLNRNDIRATWESG